MFRNTSLRVNVSSHGYACMMQTETGVTQRFHEEQR